MTGSKEDDDSGDDAPVVGGGWRAGNFSEPKAKGHKKQKSMAAAPSVPVGKLDEDSCLLALQQPKMSKNARRKANKKAKQEGP